MNPPPEPVHAAAVDLGSNSFHMVIATWEDGVLRVVDRIRERVLLASALDRKARLSDDGVERAMATLARFSQRLEELPNPRVRAVGTNTFRVVRDPKDFHAIAEEALGQRIGILAGAEEARMIYKGIRYDIGRQGDMILAVDIGGGSTELMAGEGAAPTVAESMNMGSGSWTERFFQGGEIHPKAMRNATLAAERKVARYRRRLPQADQAHCFGSSGTVLSLARILLRAGWVTEGSITREALERLYRDIEEENHLDDFQLDGLSSGRRSTFLGGMCILMGVMRALDIQQLHTTEAALREGLLLDLLGRLGGGEEDLRESTVEHMQNRYRIDLDQAQRVAKTAKALAKEAGKPWNYAKEDRLELRWAAALHEMGLFIRHQGFHRHGAWLIANADMPGFSTGECARLAFLLRQQRQGFSVKSIEEFAKRDREGITQSTLLLRLAVLLHRTRAPEGMPLRFEAPKAQRMEVIAPDGWWEDHPLTALDVEEEAEHWSEHGYRLVAMEERP